MEVDMTHPSAPNEPFFHTYLLEKCNLKKTAKIKLLDLGCGTGEMVQNYLSLGYDAYGCDIQPEWEKDPSQDPARFKIISWTPYRIPFEDNSLDAVLSTSVMEHVQNKRQCLQEIHRVLKPGGVSLHAFPAKWYLPSEPHIRVPLVNFFSPNCPRWWLAFWALCGVRNEFQTGKSWKEVVELNQKYCKEGLCYWKNNDYRQLSQEVFGNHSSPMKFFINNNNGGAAKLLKKLPFKGISGQILGNLRHHFMVSKKLSPASQPAGRVPLPRQAILDLKAKGVHRKKNQRQVV